VLPHSSQISSGSFETLTIQIPAIDEPTGMVLTPKTERNTRGIAPQAGASDGDSEREVAIPCLLRNVAIATGDENPVAFLFPAEPVPVVPR
jgi:hypothetical protein